MGEKKKNKNKNISKLPFHFGFLVLSHSLKGSKTKAHAGKLRVPDPRRPARGHGDLCPQRPASSAAPRLRGWGASGATGTHCTVRQTEHRVLKLATFQDTLRVLFC